ncbi:MAG: PAS domain-containing protein [Proteobacteria bacterium]|nr:PAS domain-containing protein [Pseudomonadota bacterium]
MTEFLAQIRHPDLRRLYEYWDARRAGRACPARQEIDPLDLKYAIGHLMLIDVLRDPLQFRYRLIGTHVTQRMGCDLTGKTVDEVPDPAYREQIRKSFGAVVESGRPSLSHYERPIRGQPRRFEVLRLPLSDDGATVNMLLVAAMYFEPLPRLSPVADPFRGAAGALRTVEIP